MNLFRLKVDIAALYETRLASKDSIRENVYSQHGKSVDERREHSVGVFDVKNTLLQSVEDGSHWKNHFTTLRSHTKKGATTLVSVFISFILKNK